MSLLFCVILFYGIYQSASLFCILKRSKHAKYLFHRIGHILFCMIGLHGIFKRNCAPHNREKGINSCCMTGFCIFRHAAGKCKHRFLKFFGNLCNAGRCFPHDGLTIQTAFSGDDNICIFYIVGKMGFFQNDVYTGFQSGMEKGEKSKPKATGSPAPACAGFVSGKLFLASAA